MGDAAFGKPDDHCLHTLWSTDENPEVLELKLIEGCTEHQLLGIDSKVRQENKGRVDEMARSLRSVTR